MNNIYTKTNLKTKTQKDDSSLNDLRDPNIIFPQSGRNTGFASVSESIGAQVKTNPVMLRSFNKDISEAMAKKKSLVSKEDIKHPAMRQSPKIPTAPAISSFNKPTVSIDSKKILDIQEKYSGIKTETGPIPSAPAPERVVSKKEVGHIEKIVRPQFVDENLKKEKKLSSEIFPRPPQVPRTREQEFIKKVALFQQKSGFVDQDIQKKQKLRDTFDRMILGEHGDNQNLSQAKELFKVTPEKILSRQEKKIEKELNPILSEKAISIHISKDDLKKLKEEILNIDIEEKELQSKLQELIKQEIALTKEENEIEADKKLIKKHIDDILQQESKIESLIHDFEKQEKETSNVERLHNIETERWSQEEKRAQFEKNKWGLNEKYDKLLALLKEKKAKLEQTRGSKDDLNKRHYPLLEEKRQKENKIRLGEIEQKKEEIENVQMTFLEEKKSIDKTLALLKENRQKVIEERRIAEENEAKVEAMSEKRIFEEKRQNMEIRQRSIEQQRWEAEQKLEKIMENLKKANEQYKTTTNMEEEIRKKLQ